MPKPKPTLNSADIDLIRRIFTDAIDANNKQVNNLIEKALFINNTQLAIMFDDKVRGHELVTKKNLSHLPSKDEFYKKMDEVLGEVQSERQENTVQQETLEKHHHRINRLESKLGIVTD